MANAGDDLRNVSRGDKLRWKAVVYNALMEILRERRSNGENFGAPFLPSTVDTSVKITVYNTLAETIPEFGILGVNAPSILPTSSLDGFRNSRVLEGVSPTPSGPFVITQEPIAQGKLGDAICLGITPVKVNITDATHEYASPTGSRVELTSGTGGPVRLIWKTAGTGADKWALAQVNAAAVTGGGGSGGKPLEYFRHVGTDNYFTTPYASYNLGDNGTFTGNTMYAMPFPALRGGTLDRIAFFITTIAVGNARVGIYKATSDLDLDADALIVDSGDISTNTAGIRQATINITLTEGNLYWLVLVKDGATATLQRLWDSTLIHHQVFGVKAAGTVNNIFRKGAFVFGALSDPAPTLTTGEVIVPWVGVRYSA